MHYEFEQYDLFSFNAFQDEIYPFHLSFILSLREDHGIIISDHWYTSCADKQGVSHTCKTFNHNYTQLFISII